MNRLQLYIPIGLFFILAGFLFFGLGNDPTKLPSVMVGKSVPKFDLPTLDSNLESNATDLDLLGEPYLLNVWATWCPTCLHEHPFLYSLSQQGIKIVGIDYQDESEAAIAWLEKYKNPYAVTLFDEKGRLGFDLGVTGAPETFLVNAEGELVYRHVGVVDEAVWNAHFKAAFE